MSPKRLSYFVDALIVFREGAPIDVPDDETSEDRVRTQIEGELLRRGYESKVDVHWGPHNLLAKITSLKSLPRPFLNEIPCVYLQ